MQKSTLTLVRGDDQTVGLTIKNVDNSPYILSGCSILFSAREDQNYFSNPVLTKTITGHVDAALGLSQIIFVPTDTSGLNDLSRYFDIKLISTGSQVSTLTYGDFNIVPGDICQTSVINQSLAISVNPNASISFYAADFAFLNSLAGQTAADAASAAASANTAAQQAIIASGYATTSSGYAALSLSYANTSSGYADSANAKVLHDNISGNIDYIGRAPHNSLTSANVWIISKITVASSGSVSVGVATGAIWDNRYILIYT